MNEISKRNFENFQNVPRWLQQNRWQKNWQNCCSQ